MTRRKKKAEHRPTPLAVSQHDRFRPWLLGGMMALCVARPLFPGESAATYGDGMSMVMFWIALAVFWLLGAVGRPTFSIRFGWTDAAVLLLVAWHGVATFWAMGHGTPRPAVNMFWEWLGMGLCFLVARQLVATVCEARAVAVVMIALAVALSGYGLYQYGYEMPNTRAEYRANPDRAMREVGLWFPPDSPERGLFESRLECREPIATFALTNSLAAYLAPWLVVLAGIGISCMRNRKRLMAVVVCLIPIAVCLALTKSRSGIIATGVGLSLLPLVYWQHKIRIGWKTPMAIGTVAAVLFLAVALGGFGGGLVAKATKSFGYRVQYWQSSLRMIADHPIVGCGPGNFQNAYVQYKLPEASEEVADPHNFLLEICATAGTPAALLFLAVLGCFAWTVWRRAERQVGSESEISNPSALTLTLSQGERGLGATLSEREKGPTIILVGGALGFLLSMPVGMLSAAPQGIAVVVLGLPLAIAVMVLLRGWIRDGQMPRWLPAVGVVVMLVDLSTTGGIGYPSVAGSLWLLLALGLQGEQPWVLRPMAGWLTLAVAVVLAVACYWTAYSPVLGCQTLLRLAEREPTRAVEHFEAAAAADPLSAEPWRQLAAVEFERWRQQPNQDVFARFEQANTKALELASNSAPAWLASGDLYFQAFFRMDREGKKEAADLIDHALSAYCEAVRLYPNSALYRAKLAEACQAAGDATGFRREAEAALRLDDLTPHRDKKLPSDMQKRLLQGIDDGT